jgi:purine nucleosidase
MTRIVLDTDLAMGAPGSDVDDGFALALAIAEPDIEIELITTVGGNSVVETSTRLTEELLAVLGRTDIPVVTGAAVPLDPGCRPAGPSAPAGPPAAGSAPAAGYAAAACSSSRPTSAGCRGSTTSGATRTRQPSY